MKQNENNQHIRDFLSRLTIAGHAQKRYAKKGKAVKMVKDTISAYPVFHAIEEIKSIGGLNYKLLRKDYGKDQIKDLMRKRPGIVSFKGDAKLDEVANAHGFQDGDVLLNTIMDTPSKKAIIKDIRSKMETDILKNYELTKRKFERTNGIYPENLDTGDEIYMGGYYMVVGFNEDFISLQGELELIRMPINKKLPCEAVKLKGD